MGAFKPKPYDPDRKDTRTRAQLAASIRNFRIFQLRGLQAQLFLLTGKRRERAIKIVDEELRAMGALSEADHRKKQDADWQKRREKHASQIPF